MIKRSRNNESRVEKTTPQKTSFRRPTTLTPEKIHTLIEQKAYELYCQKGYRDGDHVGDWLTAENEVKRELRLQC